MFTEQPSVSHPTPFHHTASWIFSLQDYRESGRPRHLFTLSLGFAILTIIVLFVRNFEMHFKFVTFRLIHFSTPPCLLFRSCFSQFTFSTFHFFFAFALYDRSAFPLPVSTARFFGNFNFLTSRFLASQNPDVLIFCISVSWGSVFCIPTFRRPAFFVLLLCFCISLFFALEVSGFTSFTPPFFGVLFFYTLTFRLVLLLYFHFSTSRFCTSKFPHFILHISSFRRHYSINKLTYLQFFAVPPIGLPLLDPTANDS